MGAFVALLRASTAVTRQLNAELVADHGLTINDYEALLRLSRADDQQMKRVELADSLILTASGVTRLLDGLECAGYVRKGSCSSDARISYAVLTDEGRAKLEEASVSHVAGIRELFEARHDAEELATLARLLERLPGGADFDEGDCSPP